MIKYVLGLGSSHPLGLKYLNKANEEINKNIYMQVHGQSKMFKTKGVHTNFNQLFFNSAIAIGSSLDATTLFRELRTIENSLGRLRAYKNSPRTIDIDILFANPSPRTTFGFYLPHREFFKRDFFIMPAINALKNANWPINATLRFSKRKFYNSKITPLFAKSFGRI